MDFEELRQFALDERRIHDPGQQRDNGYERCALCHYTRHPCEVYELAEAVIGLLDVIERPITIELD